MADKGLSSLESVFGRQASQPLDVFPIALLELQDNGEIVHFNSAWSDLMEAPGEGRNMVDYVHQEDRSLWRQALYELRQRPATSFSQRLRFVHPQGDLRWFDISLKRRDLRFYLVVNDITQHKRREIACGQQHQDCLGEGRGHLFRQP